MVREISDISLSEFLCDTCHACIILHYRVHRGKCKLIFNICLYFVISEDKAYEIFRQLFLLGFLIDGRHYINTGNNGVFALIVCNRKGKHIQIHIRIGFLDIGDRPVSLEHHGCLAVGKVDISVIIALTQKVLLSVPGECQNLLSRLLVSTQKCGLSLSSVQEKVHSRQVHSGPPVQESFKVK